MTLTHLAGALGIALLSSAALAQPALAQQAPRAMSDIGTTSPLDRQFAARAAASNTFEIRSSQMALRKSHDPAVRALAHWMIESHTMAAAKLRAATRNGEGLDGAPVVTPTTDGMLSDLGGLDGAAFDKAYVADQVAAHQMTADQMSDYAVQGSYAPLLRYDAATLPEVQDHLAHFRDLQAEMSGRFRFNDSTSF